MYNNAIQLKLTADIQKAQGEFWMCNIEDGYYIRILECDGRLATFCLATENYQDVGDTAKMSLDGILQYFRAIPSPKELADNIAALNKALPNEIAALKEKALLEQRTNMIMLEPITEKQIAQAQYIGDVTINPEDIGKVMHVHFANNVRLFVFNDGGYGEVGLLPRFAKGLLERYSQMSVHKLCCRINTKKRNSVSFFIWGEEKPMIPPAVKVTRFSV